MTRNRWSTPLHTSTQTPTISTPPPRYFCSLPAHSRIGLSWEPTDSFTPFVLFLSSIRCEGVLFLRTPFFVALLHSPELDFVRREIRPPTTSGLSRGGAASLRRVETQHTASLVSGSGSPRERERKTRG